MMISGRGGRGVCATALSSARRLLATGLVLLAILATGCSVTGKVRSAFGGQLPLKVTVAPGANDDTPIAGDLVVVYDHKLLDQIKKVPAAGGGSKKKPFPG